MKTFIAIAGLAIVATAANAQVTLVGTGGDIPDATTAGGPGSISSTVNAGVGVVSVNWVEVRGLRHSWAGDLQIELTGPGGQVVSLVNKVRAATITAFGDSTNFGGDGTVTGTLLEGRDYRFIVGGANIWDAVLALDGATGLAAGDYEPSSNLFTSDVTTSYSATNFSSFANSAAGDWTLTIRDTATGDIGAFNAWAINVNPVPEPATLAALGLGFAAVLRRRKKA